MPSTTPSPLRPRRPALLAALLLALPLAACAGGDPDRTGSLPADGYRERHPIVVEEGAETLDLPVGVQTGHLTPRLLSAVESFGREAIAQRTTTITILTPRGSVNEAAARIAATEATAALGRAGIPARAISRRTYTAIGPDDAAPVRLSFPRIVARVPHPCGEWPDQVVGSFTGFENGAYWNFGCASQANIAAMAVDPSDFVSPAGLGVGDTTRDVRVITNYRKGEKTRSDFDLKSTRTSSAGGGE
jgi:pilus assembly protein CpaD